MIQEQDAEFMRLAIEAAKEAKKTGDLPFGAVVVCDGKVVGVGYSEANTVGDVTDHAELQALRRACKALGRNNLGDCAIYCTNEPCNMCGAGIFQADIPRVVIGASRSDLSWLMRPRNIRIDDLAKDTRYEVQIERDVLKDEVLALFKDLKKDKI